MKALLRRIKGWFIPGTPEDSPRTALNWLILFAPFIAVGLWHHRSFEFWAWLACVAMWTWNITYAFVNRNYWRLFKELNENTQATMHTIMADIQVAYYRLHEHCPNCGARLKPPEVRQ